MLPATQDPFSLMWHPLVPSVYDQTCTSVSIFSVSSSVFVQDLYFNPGSLLSGRLSPLFMTKLAPNWILWCLLM